jgi:hypothetical protein
MAVGSMDAAFESLDNYWQSRAGDDGKMSIIFATYFKSKEVMFVALERLSFASAHDDTISFPTGISARVMIVTDLDRVALVFLQGRFTKDQAREVIPVFSKYADRAANEKRLAKDAAGLAVKLQDGGKGGVVWIDWPEAGRSWLKFWK